jgi:hypothetical protein
MHTGSASEVLLGGSMWAGGVLRVPLGRRARHNALLHGKA